MGVKQLWTLLGPVGRPVLLETMEGKIVAIDSSIWIYQFQATMRDKEGRALVNAHLLGFLRRICKLLFYGMKPVFVFDGGAPTLKRTTLAERRKKKSGAAASHAKVAERLLAAQLRREAVKHVSKSSAHTGSRPPDGAIDETSVFLEDVDTAAAQRLAVKPTVSIAEGQGHDGPSRSPVKKATKTAQWWQDHDPYNLPDLNMEEAITKATSSAVPDPRLATEEELQAFIDEMRPEDFDISSSDFRELPTELQYEIIGDLRLKSRQTSHKRLQSMLKAAATPLDFSKAQIKNLQQRNTLTQQLLTTVDLIGKAHIEIPTRIASERNREYILVKNEGADGGWVLGIRDEGTQEKPIQVDRSSDKEDSDDSMEAVVPPPSSSRSAKPDPDLRHYRQTMALSAIAKRYSPKKLAPLTTKTRRSPTKPLFFPDVDEDAETRLEDPDEGDPQLLVAIHESLMQLEEDKLHNGRQEPKGILNDPNSPHDSEQEWMDVSIPADNTVRSPGLSNRGPSTTEKKLAEPKASHPPRDITPTLSRVTAASMLFGLPTLLLEETPTATLRDTDQHSEEFTVDSDGSSQQVAAPTGTGSGNLTEDNPMDGSDDDMEDVLLAATPESSHMSSFETPSVVQTPGPDQLDLATTRIHHHLDSEVTPSRSTIPKYIAVPEPPKTPTSFDQAGQVSYPAQIVHLENKDTRQNTSTVTPRSSYPSKTATLLPPGPDLYMQKEVIVSPQPASGPVDQDMWGESAIQTKNSGSSEELEGWSRSPSPELLGNEGLSPQEGRATKTHKATNEDFDAAHEIDVQAEEGDFAQFMSQVKSRDLNAVRQEIDDEIRILTKEKKAAMRDSEDVTQQMTSQIKMMLRLFGIPYVVAPVEAEAQCATLAELGLVDGIITDDSDVFLFGGIRVYRNMFNQSKTVECFLLSDLSKELGLDRGKLIQLAYLLGSDYVEGLPGVGPVVAMEILREFKGGNGLNDFKDWWTKVQSGRDKPEDTSTPFRKRFKKKFKDLYLPDNWPNPLVTDGYRHPTIDDSRETFKWTLPDLDALRGFLGEELGWSITKVDDTLLPIVRKVGQRGQQNAMNRQANLNSYLDIAAGSGTLAPKQKKAYASKRLQKVVSDFRNGRSRSASVARQSESEGEGASPKVQTGDLKGKPKRTKPRAPKASSEAKSNKTRAKKRRKVDDEDDFEADLESEKEGQPSDTPKPRPRPRRKTKPVLIDDRSEMDGKQDDISD